jgi:hypothetical protein
MEFRKYGAASWGSPPPNFANMLPDELLQLLRRGIAIMSPITGMKPTAISKVLSMSNSLDFSFWIPMIAAKLFHAALTLIPCSNCQQLAS